MSADPGTAQRLPSRRGLTSKMKEALARAGRRSETHVSRASGSAAVGDPIGCSSERWRCSARS
eukprot:15441896-Alexandrium_andersonii.AAC.1